VKCDCLLDDEESGSQSNFREKLSEQIPTKDHPVPAVEDIQGNESKHILCVK